MAEGQRRYKTRQRELVRNYLALNTDRYLSVDDVWSGIAAEGQSVGRTTVYRYLEAMAQEGAALKATTPGGEARYRAVDESATGTLVCLECGRAFPLDCQMAEDFQEHVFEHHGFRVDATRTVLYGRCSNCLGDAGIHTTHAHDAACCRERM